MLIAGILLLTGCLVLLVIARPPERHASFRLGIGPQMAVRQGLGGSASQGGTAAYREALEAISGVRLELRRASSIECAVSLLRAGAVDGVAFSLPSTRSLLPATAVVSAPFYTGTSVLVSRRTAPYGSLVSLAGRRVAVIGSGEYHAYLAQHFPDIEIFPLTSPNDMLAALDGGAVDAALGADGILVPLTRRDHDAILQVHTARDGPPVELRIASTANRAVEVNMAHQALLTLPVDTQHAILERTLRAVYRTPPTIRAVIAYYRLPITLLCMALLALLLVASSAYRRARRAAARQAAAAQVLTLVNHEVRNSAASVISAIDMAEGEPDPARRALHVTSARSAADALRHTLTNALEFMFHAASQRNCPLSRHGASEVLQACLSAMRPLALSKGLRLTMELEPSLAGRAQCDARALHHIASNLISNAIKFSDAGTVSVRLSFLRGVGTLGRLVLRVTDTGPGIAPEDISRIFNAYSGTSQGRARLGTGIGLNLCRRIAISQGGDITVNSQLGAGSSFTATLRAGLDDAAPAMAPATVQAAPRPVVRALVVEDQPAIAERIKRRLAPQFHVQIAACGADAIAQADAAGLFALITLDGDLLDLTGSEVATAIRDIERRRGWPSARVISISGDLGAGEQRAYRDAGVQCFVCKPIDWVTFDAAVSGPGNRSPSDRHGFAPSSDVLAIYAKQMVEDIAGLEALISAHNWRGSLAMAHRIQGAASMVGDTRAVEAICTLQSCLKVHAINGDPAEDDLWELVALLSHLREAAAPSPPAPP